MEEDREYLKKRLFELATRASRTGMNQYTRFLDPAAERDCLSAAARAGTTVRFFGGFDGAERRICAFGEDEGVYPIVCLLLEWNDKYAHPSHRDLLGAVMNLGLERDATGDIAFAAKDGTACLFAHEDVADYLCANLTSAKNASLRVRRADAMPELRGPEGDTIRVTVQSERLDGVLAAGYRLSRGEAQRLISQGLVKHNHIEERRGDARVAEGDILSARGYGRLRVDGIDGTTRRGRIAMRLFVYKG